MLNELWIKLILVFSITVFPQTVVAINCNEPSPNLIIEGEHYYDILDVKPLTAKQKSAINKLLSSLKNKLNGKNVTTQCKGLESDPKKVVVHEKISADLNLDSDGQLTLFLTSYNSRNKISLNETLSYFGPNNHYLTVEYSENEIFIGMKYRKRIGKNSASILHEEIIRFHVDRGRLGLRTTRYINGYFAIEYDRTLK